MRALLQRSRREGPLWIGAAVVEGAWLVLAAQGDLRPVVPRFWMLFAIAFAGYLLGAASVARQRGSLAAILIGAAVFRLTLLPAAPSLSDDIYRYLWDGRVQLAAINPYLHAPADAAVEELRDAHYPNINHKSVPTIYPPLAQLFFLGVSAASHTVPAMKIALLCCEALLAATLILLLRRIGRDPRWVLLYLWNPLAVLEIAGSGHVDALGAALLMAAAALMLDGRRAPAALTLAAAVLGKLLPLLAAPLFWREFGKHDGRDLRAWLRPGGRLPFLLLPLGVLAGYAPYAGAGTGLFDGLSAYAARWRFNDSVFSVVFEGLQLSGVDTDGAHAAARLICAGGIAFASVAAPVLIANPLRVLFAVLAVFILFSPTLHPWYLLWILPFLPFFPSPAWLCLSGLVVFSYEVLERYVELGVWEEQAWVKWVEFAPFYLLLAAVPILRGRLPSFRWYATADGG